MNTSIASELEHCNEDTDYIRVYRHVIDLRALEVIYCM